jgi:hypothetical protein
LRRQGARGPDGPGGPQHGRQPGPTAKVATSRSTATLSATNGCRCRRAAASRPNIAGCPATPRSSSSCRARPTRPCLAGVVRGRVQQGAGADHLDSCAWSSCGRARGGRPRG